MSLFESVSWIALGFVPTLAVMEAAWRMARSRQTKLFGTSQVKL